MKLSIITLTYNKLEYTKRYLESLYKYTSDFELILVDNGSKDGTVDFLQRLANEKNNVKLILNENNLGFSKGNNQGIDVAEGEYIGFLNNDILLSPNWFEECEKVFLSENPAFISPREINPFFDDTDDKKYLKYFKDLDLKNDYEKSYDDCVFSCVLTKKRIVAQIGNFDETYTPAFYEDDDYKCRAIENGYGIYVCNTVCFFHYGSVTSLKLNYNFKKNQAYFYSKYPFGEYIAINGSYNRSLRHQLYVYNRFPFKQLYKMHLKLLKVKNFLRKFI